ncbi:MAG: 3-deoxy-manno-octulosonate cytidylyltransferase [Bacteroidetes bacterium 43-93]|nr:3-deoxy-manno-octulosonate cytidylyltransferase [Bacteroidota bacterium]OJW95572.1 MAG: 3-deoxy-manno-octulosonate cytidylyltransferase [Bacteroidetes bacterium 43-93]
MIVGIIPARYASTRFPGKPLIDIRGKSMIQRVYEQASKSSSLDKVVVATDDERIKEHVLAFGGNVVMTAEDHPSGTDRCWDALQQIEGKYDYVINIQGDEPFIDPSQIDTLAAVLKDGTTELATLIIPVDNHEVLFDMGEVKVVLNDNMEGMYFSRMVIPYIKGVPQESWHQHHDYYRHVGMYAYRTDVLEQLTALPVSSLEKAESLEQLRWLQKGFKIKCAITQFDSHCIDTPEDVEKVLRLMNIG